MYESLFTSQNRKTSLVINLLISRRKKEQKLNFKAHQRAEGRRRTVNIWSSSKDTSHVSTLFYKLIMAFEVTIATVKRFFMICWLLLMTSQHYSVVKWHFKAPQKFKLLFNLPSDDTKRLLAKSALFPTSITAFCAIFSLVQSACKTRSATRKELLSEEE